MSCDVVCLCNCTRSSFCWAKWGFWVFPLQIHLLEGLQFPLSTFMSVKMGEGWNQLRVILLKCFTMSELIYQFNWPLVANKAKRSHVSFVQRFILRPSTSQQLISLLSKLQQQIQNLTQFNHSFPIHLQFFSWFGVSKEMYHPAGGKKSLAGEPPWNFNLQGLLGCPRKLVNGCKWLVNCL